MTQTLRYLLPVALFVSLISFTARPASAAFSPIGISIVPPLELPPSDFTIVGARLSAGWGENISSYGLDVGGLGNITDQNFVGLAVAGGFNLNKGSSTIVGLQFAGITNVNENKTTVVGLQVAGLLNSNQAESSVAGLQVALANYAPYTHIMGVQAGVYNRAHIVTGFQIGLVNSTDVLHGVQIGLLNFNHQGLFAFAPILNVGF
jgi:hypothetical protein